MDWSFVLLILVILSLSMYVVNRDKIKKLERSTKIDNIEMKIRISYNEIKNMSPLFQIIIISCIIAISTFILILLNDFITIIILPFILIILDIFNINRNKDKNESRTFESETEFKSWERREEYFKNEWLGKFPLKYLKANNKENPTIIYSIIGITLGIIFIIFSLVFITEWTEAVNQNQTEYCQSYGLYDRDGELYAAPEALGGEWGSSDSWIYEYCSDVRSSFSKNPNFRHLREYFHSPLNGLHLGEESLFDGFLRLDYSFWGHWDNDELGPNQYHFWFLYLLGALGCLIGINSGELKRRKIVQLKKKRRAEKMSALTKLAKDPQGVVEGRISFPSNIEPIEPTKSNYQFGITLCVIVALLVIMSISSIFNGINNSNFAKNVEVSIDKDYNLCWSNLEGNCYDHINARLNDVYDDKGTPWVNEWEQWGYYNDGSYEDIDEDIINITILHGLQLSLLLILFICSINILLGTYKTEDEDSENEIQKTPELENEQEVEEEDKEEKIDEVPKHTGPISFEHVLKALGRELENARAESSALRFELNMTKEKVQTLEVEVEEKNKELDDIQDLQKNMIKIADEDEKKERGEGKSLSLMDSVLSGDVLFDSSKIDQQIINDPEAIAKAAINAYREGKKDSQE